MKGSEMFEQVTETNRLLDEYNYIDEICPNCNGTGVLPIFKICDYTYTKGTCHLCKGSGFVKRKIKE